MANGLESAPSTSLECAITVVSERETLTSLCSPAPKSYSPTRNSVSMAGGWDACQDGMGGGSESGRVIECYVAPFVHHLVSRI